jgi:transposase-like protein
MLSFKGMRFSIDVILVCIRWYAGYPPSYRHLEEMMEERGVSVDHSAINLWAIRFLPLIEKMAVNTSAWSAAAGAWMRPTSKSRASGNTSTAPSTSTAKPSTSC